ncbi:DUF1328 domain-containing protein [Kordiimonas pumila]|uniref:UPF0391 membrane protein ACFOKA_13805 n=1 Tax=Kordiimonas pumila TaxID=2161677 RepID=A0ABV7D789_9PROT|nr:DUF1328 domain-containing protein [Kordiimonas pumila]
MLSWALTFFILAIVAAIFGFGGIAGTLAGAAKLLFLAFIILFIVTLIANVIRGKGTPPPL